ncbi:hypothetical protein BH23ACT9_BH23ACT9_19420 [soil metagenome]
MLKQNSFLEYVYFTDDETLAPVAYSTASMLLAMPPAG